MDAAAELGGNPVSKYQIQPEYGDEQADAGRDCRTRLARPSSQARTRTEKYSFPCSADHEQDWQPHPVDPYSCYMCDHTYIHIYVKLRNSPSCNNLVCVRARARVCVCAFIKLHPSHSMPLALILPGGYQ